MADSAAETVIGRITSVFGIKGWLKVYSYTDPMDGILSYENWVAILDGKRIPLSVTEGKRHGPGIVVKLKGIEDRDQASRYAGADIAVPIADLPELPEDEFYWHQLEKLRVITVDGQLLGQVHHLMETGSNDVLVVRPCEGSLDQRERLLPYLPDQVVVKVDLAAGEMQVDWDPEF